MKRDSQEARVAANAAANEAIRIPFQKPNRAPATTVKGVAVGRKRVDRAKTAK